MKRKQLGSLRLKKSTVSSLNVQAITGGTIFTLRKPCPNPIDVPQATVTTCSQFADCDSKQICTANRCKTFELDADTKPVC